ncbi:hypothetical protein HY024_03580 [Candidatus Curtissbacteria bacterium]|nr:hypothetical protein [Candidatus Curtissbacteria bacterium]
MERILAQAGDSSAGASGTRPPREISETEKFIGERVIRLQKEPNMPREPRDGIGMVGEKARRCNTVFSIENMPLGGLRLSLSVMDAPSGDFDSFQAGVAQNAITVDLELDGHLTQTDFRFSFTRVTPDAILQESDAMATLLDPNDPNNEIMTRWSRVAAQLQEERARNAVPQAILDLVTAREQVYTSPRMPVEVTRVRDEVLNYVRVAVSEYFAENSIPALYLRQPLPENIVSSGVLGAAVRGLSQEPTPEELFTLSNLVKRNLTEARFIDTEPGPYASCDSDAYLSLFRPVNVVDYINLSILHAKLSGDSDPYTPEELREFASRWNRSFGTRLPASIIGSLKPKEEVVGEQANLGNYKRALTSYLQDRRLGGLSMRDLRRSRLDPDFRAEMWITVNGEEVRINAAGPTIESARLETYRRMLQELQAREQSSR